MEGTGEGGEGVKFWQSWVDVVEAGLTVSKVRGSHLSMMQPPHVEHVAGRVKAFTAIR